MKTLTEAQERAVKICTNAIAEYGSALNSSVTGTGKTVMAVHTAMRLRCPVVVIAPKAVLPSWRKEFAEHGILPLLVVNYEKIRRGHKQFLTKNGKRSMRWNLPEDTLIIFDEVQRCKSPYTQNSLLLISAKMQKINTLLLSATAAEDCTEMRSLGYALDLHSLNRGTATRKSWIEWMKQHGCTQDNWGGWRSGGRAKLKEIHNVMYRDRAIRLVTDDMPEAFRSNHIIEEIVEFEAMSAIRRFYKDAGITPAVIDAYVEHQSLALIDPEAAEAMKETNVLTEMLRARQMAEACKIPEIVEMASDLITEGFSVAVFLNFRDTVTAFKAAMETVLGKEISVIIGGQKEDERSSNVLEFSDDRRRVIVCTAAAGGTGVDGLQDLHGKYPRVSLISPSFSAQEFKQVLGRLPRAYAKSGVIQKILIAAGTIEEYVLKAIHKKLANLESLHGK